MAHVFLHILILHISHTIHMNLPCNHANERHTIQTHTRVRRPASHPTLRRHSNPSSPAPVKSGKVLRRTPHAPIIAPLLLFATHVGMHKLLKTSHTMHIGNTNPGDRTRRPSSRKTNALPTELTRPTLIFHLIRN